ncbi:hypothetical protein [Microbacterium sp. NPDC076911]|uniref:glycoside hydrolase family 38 N-terminal domain-containing protein n=1 Tax=Microbacterium sp. NPDC076911 TaxID=3154958 RepID=UPI00343B6080
MTARSRVLSAHSTDLFVDTPEGCLQVVRVRVECPPGSGPTIVSVVGADVMGDAELPVRSGIFCVDVPVSTTGAFATELPARVSLYFGEDRTWVTSADVTVVVAEPGWSIHLVSHFHFDPVWWNTQAGSVTEWEHTVWSGSPQLLFQKSAVDVLLDHLRRAESDPQYRFVVAELDYLKPFRDRYPEYRETLDRLIAQQRVEVVGGTTNEPDSVLPAIETLRRNFRFGLQYQRDVMKAPVSTAWALDVFGHAPQFPAVAAEAGLSSVALARGAYHQWGQLRNDAFDSPHDEPRQHSTDALWTAPGGSALQLHSLPMHYTGGHPIDTADTLEEAEALLMQWLALMSPHASARSVLVPAGTDLAPPVRWITELPRHFAEHYAWPKVKCSLPSEFFGEVAAQSLLAPRLGHAEGLRVLTRDLNPIYTGKDVSYADIKAAHSRIERSAIDAEIWASLLGRASLGGADLDRVWRILVWLSHHDAVTGTSSDQVYIDMVAMWMEAGDIVRRALGSTLHALGSQIDASARQGVAFVVANSQSQDIGGVVRTTLDVRANGSVGLSVVDEAGQTVPVVVDGATFSDDGVLLEAELSVSVTSVPGVGYTTLWAVGAESVPQWIDDYETTIRSSRHEVEVDPMRGGGIIRFIDKRVGRDLVADGALAGELVADFEHPTHPHVGEGPWHLLPTGERERVGERPATRTTRQRSPIGERLVVEGPLPDACGVKARHTTTYFLPVRDGASLEVSHRLEGQSIDNRLLRVSWPVPVPGSRPVVAAGEAVIGRGHGFTTADSAVHPWTLDSAFHGWFAQSSVCRVVAGNTYRAIGAAEIIAGAADPASQHLGDVLSLAFARSGVTATPTRDIDARVGDLNLDSNLIDVRVVISGLDEDSIPTATLLRQPGLRLNEGVTWIPARESLEHQWVPGADLTSVAALPILAIVAKTVEQRQRLVSALVEHLDASHEIVVDSSSPFGPGGELVHGEHQFEDLTIAIVTLDAHSGVIETDGTMWLNLRRSSTAWPSGQWIDPPRRTLPDGSAFGSQHWTHEVNYMVVVGEGDWRSAQIDNCADRFLRPLRVHPIMGSGHGPASTRLLELSAGAKLEALRPTEHAAASLRVSQLGSTPMDAIIRTQTTVKAAHVSNLHDVQATPLRSSPKGWAIEIPPVASTSVLLDLDVAEQPTQRAFGTPIFSRWWTQNSGPPPANGLPVCVHLRPVRAERMLSSQEFDVVISSDAENGNEVELEFVLPKGTDLIGEPRSFRVQAGGHVTHRYSIAGDASACSVVVVGTPSDNAYPSTWDIAHLGPKRTAEMVSWTRQPSAVVLSAGSTGKIVANVKWTGSIPVQAEARVVSPFGSWELFVDPVHWAELLPDTESEFAFSLAAPRGFAPGSWWGMIVVRVADRVIYSRAVDIVVDNERNGTT